MKTIKLKSLSMKHFKGIENYAINFDGKSVDVYGDNDAGKTSLYDAFLWTLFHKNSKEETHFKWKPLDNNNNSVEGLHTVVKVVLTVNGTDMEFEKHKISKQVMKRKLERMVYEDTTKYLINGLETSTKTIYDEKVAEVLDQEKFKNLTSITYFSEQLSAKERREALFNYFGTLTDTEIILKNETLKPLIKIIGDLTVDEARQKTQQEAKRINETLKSIPVKIEGVQEAMPEISELNHQALAKEREELSVQRNGLQDQLIRIKNGGAGGEYRSQLRVKEAEMREAAIIHETQQNEKTNEIEQSKALIFTELNELKRQADDKRSEKISLQARLENAQAYKNRLEVENQKIKQRMDEIFDTTFSTVEFQALPFGENSLTCSYCGTEYSEEKKDELREHHAAEEAKRLETFNAQVAHAEKQFKDHQETQLDRLRQNGRDNVSDIEQSEEEIAELSQKLSDEAWFNVSEIEKMINEKGAKLAEITKQISAMQSERIAFNQTDNYLTIQKDIDFLKQSITESESNIQEQIKVQQEKINVVDQLIFEIDTKLATIKEYQRQQEVIEKFNEQEREFSQQKGIVLEKLMLFEEFYLAKRDLLQDKINSHFSLVEWKLFDFYEEGGLDESVCEPVINGVPFRSLNTGSRMQAGLDVANTLMKQEGYLVPIFIDNAEAITGHKRDAVTIDTQVIALYVSEEDKNLRVVKTEGKVSD